MFFLQFDDFNIMLHSGIETNEQCVYSYINNTLK